MKNKSLWLRGSLMVSIVWLFWLSFVSAINFHLNIDMDALSKTDVERSIMPIHFADNWNDFGGFFYFSNGLWDSSAANGAYNFEVEIWNGTTGYKYMCARQVKWFYYNAERWERLWPLDQSTWSTSDMNIDGWIYTVCEQPWYTDALNWCSSDDNGDSREDCEKRVREEFQTDGHWYYWNVTWSGNNQEYSLIAWVEYDAGVSNEKFVEISGNSKLAPTFVRFENKYPVGFIYDTNWWVGFVWCRVNSNGDIKKILKEVKSPNYLKGLFRLTGNNIEYIWTWRENVNCSDAVWDSLVWVVVEWILWLGERSNNPSDFWIIWNEMDEKMQYFSSANINNNTLINYAKKKAEVLCRWKWKNSSDWCGESLCCYNTSPNLLVKNKTYIVKNWNVTVEPFSLDNDEYYSVFVMNGNLVINETASTTKFVFTTGGNVSSTSLETFSSNVTGGNGKYKGKDATVASLIKWNFIVNWKIKGPAVGNDKLNNKYFIHWKFTSRDDFNSLSDTFQWRCNNWIATDWTYCPRSFKENWSYEDWRLNPYEAAFLVVIDQNYDSPLYNS